MSDYLKLKEIGKVYTRGSSEQVILSNLNFGIVEKEFVCIMGPSGCGKSTLLKIMGGIEQPTVGEITLKDSTYSNGIPKNVLKDFGYVFQNHNLLEWRTVEKNLQLPLEIFKLRGESWKKRIDEMLELVGLLEYKRVYPHELSGGMKQRVGIARALVHDPEVLLMDQPFGALDAITRHMLAVETLSIWKKTHKTLVMVTNSVEEALLVSQRVLMMDHSGQIIEEIQNDIPLSERNDALALNPRYNVLRDHMNKIVHETNQYGGDA